MSFLATVSAIANALGLVGPLTPEEMWHLNYLAKCGPLIILDLYDPDGCVETLHVGHWDGLAFNSLCVSPEGRVRFRDEAPAVYTLSGLDEAVLEVMSKLDQAPMLEVTGEIRKFEVEVTPDCVGILAALGSPPTLGFKDWVKIYDHLMESIGRIRMSPLITVFKREANDTIAGCSVLGWDYDKSWFLTHVVTTSKYPGSA